MLVCGSENAGMSSDKKGENPFRRKSKVSWARLVLPGLVGPKPRPKGVGDGQRVNIPAPPTSVETTGTPGGRLEGDWLCLSGV